MKIIGTGTGVFVANMVTDINEAAAKRYIEEGKATAFEKKKTKKEVVDSILENIEGSTTVTE